MEEEIKKTRIQQIYGNGLNRKKTKIDQVYEGKPKTIDNVVKFNSSDAFMNILKSIGFEIPKNRGKGKHTFVKHRDYPKLYTTVSGNFDDNVRRKQMKELKKFIKDINKLDAENPENKKSIYRSSRGRKILDLKEGFMNRKNNELDTINEFVNDRSVKGKLLAEEVKWVKELYHPEDFQYHGKYRNKWNMFTHIDEKNILMAWCPVLGLDISENNIGKKKDIDLLIEALEDLIDEFIYFIKKGSGGLYFCPFLGKDIRV